MGRVLRSALGGILEGASAVFDVSCVASKRNASDGNDYKRVVHDMRQEIEVMQREAAKVRESSIH